MQLGQRADEVLAMVAGDGREPVGEDVASPAPGRGTLIGSHSSRSGRPCRLASRAR